MKTKIVLHEDDLELLARALRSRLNGLFNTATDTEVKNSVCKTLYKLLMAQERIEKSKRKVKKTV